MVELLTVTGLLRGLRLAVWAKRRIEHWEGTNTANLRDAVEIAKKDYQLQLNACLESRLNALEGTTEQEEGLAALLDEEFLLLQLVYQDDAFREPRAKRRLMIAQAAAGSFAAELSLAELARVQRAMRELDPEDIAPLQALVAAESIHGTYVEHPEWEPLVAAGCARFEGNIGFGSVTDDPNHETGKLFATRTGRHVDAVMGTKP